MAFKDLTSFERQVYEYIRERDFETRPWITREAARNLKVEDIKIYEALSELTRKIRDNIWIFYRDGHLHVVAE